ncbi:MAG: DUF3052 domain-containing protein [Candidatus Heimdallarchaeota archaeon]
MSKKTVAQKLFIKDNYRVLFVNEPENYKSLLENIPKNVTVLKSPEDSIDLIQVFITSRKELEEQLVRLKSFLTLKGLLWVTYPKGTSKMKVDINRDSINKFALSIGLKGVAMISVDDTWSALRLKIIDN